MNVPAAFQLSRPGSLIAALPSIFGFVPERSLIVVAVGGGELICAARVDLSTDMSGAVARLTESTATAGADAAIAVVVDAEGAHCRMCADEYRQLIDELTTALNDQRVEMLSAHIVDRIEAGGRWHCADGCGNGGAVDDPAASPLAMAAVLDGRRLYARRSDLHEVISTRDTEHTARLGQRIDEMLQQSGELDVGARACRDVEHAITAAGRVADGATLDDDDLARLALALSDRQVRDVLFGLAVGNQAGAAETLWALLSRTLPDPPRVDALTLLAFAAYVRGDGPLAGIALEEALRIDPAHRMASMLDTALQSGLRPEKIRQLALAGYRVAARLGVELPQPT
ncbi:DUF4192 domain-containing protein [Mycolicibacterium novocastrense]|nr:MULTISPECIES: DUF4192 domain-containing protein [Mycolicibacterium]MCV7021879.1 DUF4192 domain-containing protein [Mycolicibacterium novocastrense]MDX1887931.1 DUF4192 domain-containing protein [Mycolicibacterium sp. 120270]